MIEIKLIAVVLDPTVVRDSVLDRAIMLAKSTQAKIEILINCHSILGEETYFSTEKSGADEAVNAAFQKHLLQSIENEFTDLGIPVGVDLYDEEPVADAIVERAIKIGADIVLKSTHHHSEFRKSVLTNTDWKLIRQCPIPLWFSKAGRWLARGEIVASVDPLHSNAEQVSLDSLLVSYAEQFARIEQQSACVFHAFYAGGEIKSVTLADRIANDELWRHHSQAIYRLLSKHSIRPQHVQLSVGEVSERLLSYLSGIRSNLLVVGALSRSKLERAILGSTAEKILDEAPCDVLVVRPKRSG